MLKKVLVILAFGQGALAASHILDAAHLDVGFSVRHMMVSNVKGNFKKVEGTFDFDEKKNELSKVEVQIATNSVDTNDSKRDDHLKKEDFFHVSKYPTMTFKMTQPVKLEVNKAVKVPGSLTIRGVSKPVELNLEYRGSIKDPWGNQRKGFYASTTINRKDFGVSYNSVLDNGGVAVGDEVKIEIEGEAIPKK